MSWLTPLGFLGLAGLIALIIIYIIKPNYQLKIVSSTFVWRLSLKLRKKKIPVNKLRNILLFICQVLIITSMAFLLAQPFIKKEKETVISERVAIIDASASMLSTVGVENRFERAVEDVRKLSAETLEAGGRMNIILASEEASFIVRDIGAGENSLATINEALDAILDKKNPVYTYGEADIEGAIALSDDITSKNHEVEVLLYTDTAYIDPGKITVKNVSDELEWNAAILDVRAKKTDGYYRIEIDVACYGGKDADIKVFCDINDAVTKDDGTKEDINLIANARCKAGNATTLVFGNYTEDNPDPSIIEDITLRAFESINVYVQEKDSFSHDNQFFLYGGTKPALNIQYYSSNPNNYFSTVLMVLEDKLAKSWDLNIVEVKKDKIPETEGFDIYIFEHAVPRNMPKDGVVILSDPNAVPIELGLRLGQTKSAGRPEALTPMDDHPLMNGIDPSRIELSRYTEITSYDGYIPLMSCNGSPVVMAKNEPDQKIVVMSFSLNYSNFSMLLDFPLFMTNVFSYFTPPTITDHVFDVNGSVSLNSRSESLSLVGPGVNEVFSVFPHTFDLKAPGVYTLTQTPISGVETVENFFVKIPASESNIAAVEDALENPLFIEQKNVEDKDLLVYFALALIALLFAEWWLQSREQF